MDRLNLRPRAVNRPVSHQLAKALIVNTTTGDAFSVMYNPAELTLEQGNTFAEVGIPGLDAPPTQYVRGKARALTMELFFDTYEAGVDVRSRTAPIVRLLDKQPQTKAPPVLLFSMGRLQFRCVLVDAGQRFTMFLRDGTPVRSTLSVRLQEYIKNDLEVRPGLSGAETVHVTSQGDTLSGLAAANLGDAARWREIADANTVEDPFDLLPGRALVIPAPGSRRAAGQGGRPGQAGGRP